MTYSWKAMLTACAAAVLLVGAPRAVHAACGDLNKDGSVTVTDAVTLAAVIAGTNTTACAGSNPDCDVFKGGGVDTADLSVLVAKIAGLRTLFDACSGPGPVVSCTDGTDPDTNLPIHNVPAGDITANQTWPNTCTIHIQGIAFVKTADPVNGPHTVLTVKPGTVVKGEAGGTANPAVLIVLPGSRLDAQGTADEPIIFTSGEPIGSRQIGDWGGVLLNGRSTVNRPNCLNNAEGIPAPYGGCDSADTSGVMTYTRVEFSGIEFTPNNELNIITLNGVGNSTLINHIQGNAGGDDCIEWFGGTVNVDHFVSSGCADDGFDYQLGTTGARQFGLQVQYGPFLQTGNQSRGIEADNSEFGFDDLPRSNPKFCNLTMIGARDNDINLGSQGGLFFRRGTAGTVANSLVMNYRDGCVRLDDVSTSQQACTDSTTLKTADPFLSVQSTVCYDNGGTVAVGTGTRMCAGVLQNASPAPVCSAPQYYKQLALNNHVVPSVGSCTAAGSGFSIGDACCQNSDCGSGGTCNTTGLTGPDPQIGGPGYWGSHATRWLDVTESGGGYPANVPDVHPHSTAGFPTTLADCSQIDPFMQNTNYIGAFNPDGSDNWLNTPVNSHPYAAGITHIPLKRWISFDVN